LFGRVKKLFFNSELLKKYLLWGIKRALIPFMMPFVLVAFSIRRWILFRVGPIPTHRIGAVAFNVEFYLAYKEVYGFPEKTIDLFYPTGIPANSYFTSLCRNAIILHPIFEVFWLSTYFIPGGARHRFKSRTLESAATNQDHLGLFRRTKPHLTIPADKDRRGRQYLSQIGLKEGSRFICLCLRDDSYLGQIKNKNYENDFSYHAYRDVDADNYQKAVLALADRGYWIFRMGKVVKKPFKIDHPRIIDYAYAPEKCDFLDVWLLANCYFTVSTGLGIDAIAEIFRRPLCVVDYLPSADIKFSQKGITTPKTLMWRETGIELTVEEHLLHDYYDSKKYYDAGIDVVNLSADNLTASVLHMDDQLMGNAMESQLEHDQQKYFWQMMEAHYKKRGHSITVHPEARISPSFLRQLKLPTKVI